jgi:hypothetical protein
VNFPFPSELVRGKYLRMNSYITFFSGLNSFSSPEIKILKSGVGENGTKDVKHPVKFFHNHYSEQNEDKPQNDCAQDAIKKVLCDSRFLKPGNKKVS